MKYVVEIGSGVLMYMPSFIKVAGGMQRLVVPALTDRKHGDAGSLL
jgi:hypothetical protein